MPYMGSKRKLAPKILEYIINNNSNCKYFFDLFGGGGAISFMALQYPQIEKVFYNELNTGVVELLRKVLADGVTTEMYQWIDRETFNKHKNDSDWFGGLLQTCWSFGNNQRTYIYGKPIESIKQEAHEYLFKNGYDRTSATRVKLLKQFKVDANIINRFHLQHLESLQLLQRLQHLERLQITNLSYNQVQITTPIEETIIYLDPPYKNKKEYAETLNHDELADWIKNSPYKIYLSSYEYEGLFEVKQFTHRSILSATANNKVVEKLFCNRVENTKNSLF